MEFYLILLMIAILAGAIYWGLRNGQKSDARIASLREIDTKFPDAPRYPTRPAHFDDSSMTIPERPKSFSIPVPPPVVMSRPTPRYVDHHYPSRYQDYPSTTYQGQTYYRSPEGSFYDRNGTLVNLAIGAGLGALAYSAFTHQNAAAAATTTPMQRDPVNNPVTYGDVPELPRQSVMKEETFSDEVVPMVPRQPVMREETLSEGAWGGIKESTLDRPQYDPAPSFHEERQTESNSFSDSNRLSESSFVSEERQTESSSFSDSSYSSSSDSYSSSSSDSSSSFSDSSSSFD